MRVIAREISIHQKETGGASHEERIRWLEVDRDAVRASMQAHLAANMGQY
jgi:hypothetical protein